MVQWNNSEFLFVYGTLMSMHKNEYAQFLHAHAQFLDKAYCYGCLYKIDWYPGLVVSPKNSNIVVGEIFYWDKTNSKKIFETLDLYEGIDSGEYIRSNIIVYPNFHPPISSQTYLYNQCIKGLEILS